MPFFFFHTTHTLSQNVEKKTQQISFHWGIAVEAFLLPEGDAQAPTAHATLRGRVLAESNEAGLQEGDTVDYRSQRVLGCDGWVGG